jgi:hypothetical protein
MVGSGCYSTLPDKNYLDIERYQYAKYQTEHVEGAKPPVVTEDVPQIPDGPQDITEFAVITKTTERVAMSQRLMASKSPTGSAWTS